VARNIAGLWDLVQGNSLPVTVNIDSVKEDGTFTLEAQHNGDTVRGHGSGTVRGDEVHFTINWSNNTQGAYIGAFDGGGFLNGSTFDIKNPQVHAGWKSSRAFF
jgi:hypothetical protein